MFTAAQGASIDALEIVKKLVIREIPPGQAGREYKVTFSIDADHVLTVTATDSAGDEVAVNEVDFDYVAQQREEQKEEE